MRPRGLNEWRLQYFDHAGPYVPYQKRQAGKHQRRRRNDQMREQDRSAWLAFPRPSKPTETMPPTGKTMGAHNPIKKDQSNDEFGH